MKTALIRLILLLSMILGSQAYAQSYLSNNLSTRINICSKVGEDFCMPKKLNDAEIVCEEHVDYNHVMATQPPSYDYQPGWEVCSKVNGKWQAINDKWLASIRESLEQARKLNEAQDHALVEEQAK